MSKQTRITSVLLLSAASVFLSVGAGCSKNPTTGRSQFVPMSRNEEVALGASAAPELTQEFGGKVQNQDLCNYVTEVGNKLKDQTEVDGPNRTWEFTLLDSDVINAFALPGEKVFMSRGLSDKLTNEAQLAGVLGHEIGHVMARHTAERQGQAMWVGILAQGAGIAAGAAVKDPTLGQVLPALTTQGGQIVVLKFSREQESEADSLGMRYMTKAGYNPRGQLQVMEVLKAAAGSGSQPEFLSTHPLPQTRIDDVKKKLQTEYANTQGNNSQYQFFAERYQQRYLSIAKNLPKKKQADPTAKPQKKTSVDDIDQNGRQRLLASISLDDPTTWCALCRANAAHGN